MTLDPRAAAPPTPGELRYLSGVAAPHADVFEQRELRIDWNGRTQIESIIDGHARRALWPGVREEFAFESPGARTLEPFSADDLERARAEVPVTTTGGDGGAGRAGTRIERRSRVATRNGAWERSETWLWMHEPATPPVEPLTREFRGTILLRPQAAGVLIHELIGHGCEAGAGGEAPALGVGQRLGPAHLEVVDQPAWPIDDEGTPAGEITLIRGGQVRATIGDLRSGSLSGRGRRASFRDPPLPRMSHLRTLPGLDDETDLREMAVAVVERAVHGRAGEGGAVALLLAPALQLDGRRCGPVLLRFEIAALRDLRIGASVEPDRLALCSRDGHELPSSSETPALLIDARVLPA